MAFHRIVVYYICRCGLPLATYFSATKLVWLLENVQEVGWSGLLAKKESKLRSGESCSRGGRADVWQCRHLARLEPNWWSQQREVEIHSLFSDDSRFTFVMLVNCFPTKRKEVGIIACVSGT